jgi:hypothetical protein
MSRHASGVSSPEGCMENSPGWSVLCDTRGRFVRTALLAIFVMVSPVLAHHSTARYDLTKTVVVQGTVTEVIWQNPHVILVMNDARGTEQAFEAPSPTYIVNSGWTKGTIKAGDKVTVKGSPAKNGQLPMYLITLTLANGKEYSPKNPERP